jgi:peptidoglycan DL-endopeptidase CwlO
VTPRVTGRHRAPDRVSTPLTTFTSSLSSVVGDHAAGVGRGGLVLAMSSGLVAGVSIPASATITVPARQNPGIMRTQVTPSATAGGTDAATRATAIGATADVSARTARTATISRGARGQAVPNAATPTPRSTTATRTGTGAVRGSAVIAVASRYLGVPYISGGTTPRGFDCSGYTRYVYAQLGVSLPRVAEAQRQAATAVPRSQARPGDLVFFLSGGVAYHVGIYADRGMMYDAGKPGTQVSKREIWSGNVTFGRL